MDLGNISLTSIPKPKETTTEEIPSTPSPTDSGPLEVELVFPTQAIPLSNSRNSQIFTTNLWM